LKQQKPALTPLSGRLQAQTTIDEPFSKIALGFSFYSQDDLCDCLLDTTSNGIYQAVHWVAEHYKSGTPITLLNRPIPKLKDADSWKVWKKRLLYYYKRPSLYDSSLFLYCATKHF